MFGRSETLIDPGHATPPATRIDTVCSQYTLQQIAQVTAAFGPLHKYIENQAGFEDVLFVSDADTA